MTTLSELLIQANINPHTLPNETKYIAQDKQCTIVFMYTGIPLMPYKGCEYFLSSDTVQYIVVEGETLEICLDSAASDWETPLHIDTYNQDWDNAKMKEEHIQAYAVTPEWPKIMESIISGSVVSFNSEFEGDLSGLSPYGSGKLIPIGSAKDWFSCFDKDTWKPYTIPTQTPSEPLLDVPATLTATELVKRLEGLKMALQENDNLSFALNEQHAKLSCEYDSLKEQLLNLI